jgi:hypothetical protein
MTLRDWAWSFTCLAGCRARLGTRVWDSKEGKRSSGAAAVLPWEEDLRKNPRSSREQPVPGREVSGEGQTGSWSSACGPKVTSTGSWGGKSLSQVRYCALNNFSHVFDGP